MVPSAFEQILLEEVRRPAPRPSEAPGAGISAARDEDAKARDPARWIVDLDEPFRGLARELANGRAGARRPTLLVGARGSGKSLLLRIAANIARETGTLTGELWKAADLRSASEGTPDDEGREAIELKADHWRRERNEGRLDFLLIDQPAWHDLVRGRFRQLGRSLAPDPPAVVFTLNLFQYWQLRRQHEGVEEFFKVLEIPPYSHRDLERLWMLYAGEADLDSTSIAEVIRRSLGNPDLVLDQAEAATKARERPGGMSSSFLRALWEAERYNAALQLREDPLMVKGTKREILVHVCEWGRVSATQLARHYGYDRSLCSHHLGDLEDQGLLGRTKEGPAVLYYATKPVQRAVENFVLMSYA